MNKPQHLNAFFIGIFWFLCMYFLNAQHVKVGGNFMHVNSSAILELEDSNKALLLTRVSDPKTSIKAPWKGMLAFDSSVNKLTYYNSTDWTYVGESNNIYNSDGIIENTTLNTRTIQRKDNQILFVDSSKLFFSHLRTFQMKNYDTITFGKHGRMGIGTTNPVGKLDVRGPVYIYSDYTNNAVFHHLAVASPFDMSNSLPALVIQPDTIINAFHAKSRTIFISLFNKRQPVLSPGFITNPTGSYFHSTSNNNVLFKDGRVDLGFLGYSGRDSNLFTIWNRSDNGGGFSLRTGGEGILQMQNGGQVTIRSDQLSVDSPVLTVSAFLPQKLVNDNDTVTRNRYPLLISGGVAATNLINDNFLILRSKLGILITQSASSPPPNIHASWTHIKMAYIWAMNARRPVMGISTYLTNQETGFHNNPYPDLPASNLYDVIHFYIDQPNRLRGSVPGLPVSDSNYKYQVGVTGIRIPNVASSRYSKLAFTESDLSAKWQFMKMGATPSSSTFFLPTFISKNPNDFYIVKDSTDIWMQFLYAGSKIIFYKDIDLPSAPNIVSDQRIKKIKNKVESKSALEKINAVSIVDYSMKKDTKNEGKQNRGVIAQEIEALFPEAVTTSKTTHPLSNSNIEEYAQSFRIDSSNKKQWYIEVTLPEHGLKNGVRLYLKTFNILGNFAPSHLQENVVGILDKNRFRLPYTEELANTKKLYIIGQEIKDLKTVDYSYLNMSHIAATQALSQELDEANKKIKLLEEDIAELKKIIKNLGKISSK